MGDEVKQTSYNSAHRLEYRRKVQLCLDVFETMLAESNFEFDRPLTGMEIECNLVDADYLPAMSNQEVLAVIADPAYQTELGLTTSSSTFPLGRCRGEPPWSWRARYGPV